MLTKNGNAVKVENAEENVSMGTVPNSNVHVERVPVKKKKKKEQNRAAKLTEKGLQAKIEQLKKSEKCKAKIADN